MPTAEELLAQLKAIVDAAEAEDRPMNDEELARCEQLRSEIDAVKKTAEMRSVVENYRSVNFQRVIPRMRENGDTDEEIEFRNAFMSGKLGDLAEFRAQSSTTTAGGYSIPPRFAEELIKRKKAFGGIVNEARSIVTDHWTTIDGFVTVDDTSNSAEIVAENGAPASAGVDVVLGTKSLPVYRIVASGASHTWLKVPVQLMDSSFIDWASFVADLMGERLGRLEAAYAATGSGSGQPQGLLTGAPEALNIASNATGITYNELLDLEHAVDVAYRNGGNCKWFMSDGVWKLVRKLTDDNGRPIVMEHAVSGIGSGTQKSLLGYDVVIDNSLPASWTGDDAKTMLFGDAREAFLVRHVRNPLIVSDDKQFFLNGQVGFLAASGFGSVVLNPNAVAAASSVDAP